MKTYKDFDKIFIGSSDSAALTLRTGNRVSLLNFGEDNDYYAYLVQVEYAEDVEIGAHYKLVYSTTHWLKIYDDNELVKRFRAEIINIYRAGEMGCIITLIEKPGVRLKDRSEYEITFDSPEDMLNTICGNTKDYSDLYFPDKGIYVYEYSDSGSLVIYYLNRQEAEMINRELCEGESWLDHLGSSDEIIDSPAWYEENEESMEGVDYFPIDFCKEMMGEKCLTCPWTN